MSQTVTLRITGENGQLLGVLRATQVELNKLGGAANSAGQQAAAGARGIDQVGTASDRTAQRAGLLSRVLGDVKSILLGYVGLQGVMGLGRLADDFSRMDSQLRLATQSEREYAIARRDTRDIAQRTAQDLGATVSLYARLTSSTRAYGASQREIAQITEVVNQGLRVSGASTAESASAILQLSQAFASGVLRGEEFNAVNEASPRLMQLLADSLGVTRGELRKLAEDGRLTSEVLLAAFTGAEAERVIAEGSRIPDTISGSWTRFTNALTLYVGQADRANGTSRKIADALGWVSEHLDEIVSGLISATKVYLVYQALFVAAPAIYGRATGALAAYKAQVAATAVAQTQGAAAVAAGGVTAVGVMARLRQLAVLALAAFAGWEIGTWLRENFLEARLAGIAMVNGVMKAWERLKQAGQLLWEALKLAFNSFIEKVRFGLSDLLRWYADISEKLDLFGFGEEAIAKMRQMANELRPATLAGDAFGQAVDRINAQAEAAITQIDQITGDMADYEIATAGATAATEAGAAADADRVISLGNVSDAAREAAERLREIARIRDQVGNLLASQEYDLADERGRIDLDQRRALEEILELENQLRELRALTAADEERFARARANATELHRRALERLAAEEKRRRDEALGRVRDLERSVANDLRLAQATGSQREEINRQLRDEELLRRALLELQEAGVENAEAELEKLKQQLQQLREIERIQDLREGGLEGLIGESFARAFDDSSKSFWDEFKKGLQEVFTPTGKDGQYTAKDVEGIGNFVASTANLIGYAIDQFRENKDAPLRAIANIASAIGGPIGAIANAVKAIDSIFGGKLLGTNYELKKTIREITLGEAGFDGKVTTIETKQKPLFGGTARRRKTTDLDAATQDQLDDLFEQMGLAIGTAVRELGVRIPSIVEGSFKEEYDKNGKLKSSVSTVLGKTYNETVEEFTKRLQAENLLAVIAQVLPSAELNAITDRWREDADRLSEGANLLFALTSQAQRGEQLWSATGEGVMARIVEVVELLQQPGEQLLQTYQRLTQTARAYGAIAAQAEAEIELDGVSDFAKSIVAVRREESARLKGLRDQARALGNLNAREEDLARVRAAAEVKIAQLAQAEELRLLDLAAELYGTPLEAIQAQIDALSGASTDAAARMQDFIDSLLLSDQLSPLSVRERTDLARSQLTTAAGARDVEGFIEAANAFLGLSQQLNASGSDYRADFDAVLGLAQQFGLVGAGGNLEDLIAQRDAILARQRAAERLQTASELALGIADLAEARGQSFGSVAQTLGVSLDALAGDLGLQASSLDAYLQSLQVDTQDLADLLDALPERFASALFDVLYHSDLSLPVEAEATPTTGTGTGGSTTPTFDPAVPGLIGAGNALLQQILAAIQQGNGAAQQTAAATEALVEQAGAVALYGELRSTRTLT
jgi:tape measure domain-containing protein